MKRRNFSISSQKASSNGQIYIRFFQRTCNVSLLTVSLESPLYGSKAGFGELHYNCSYPYCIDLVRLNFLISFFVRYSVSAKLTDCMLCKRQNALFLFAMSW